MPVYFMEWYQYLFISLWYQYLSFISYLLMISIYILCAWDSANTLNDSIGSTLNFLYIQYCYLQMHGNFIKVFPVIIIFLPPPLFFSLFVISRTKC